MPTFTPPAVPEGVDIMGHVWATRRAIQSWNPRRVDFQSITLHRDFYYELATHPRLQRVQSSVKLDSLWGMRLDLTDDWTTRRQYTITYEVL